MNVNELIEFERAKYGDEHINRIFELGFEFRKMKNKAMILWDDDLTEVIEDLFSGDLQTYKRNSATFEYSRKVKIPKFVADTMKLYKDLREMLTEEYYNNSIEEIDNDNIFNWIDNNFEIFCQAWLHGHEVKEEPKYYWKLVEHPKFMSGATYLGTFDGSGPKLADKGAEDMSEVSKWKTRFTEKEVRELLGEDISRFIDEPARLGL